MDQRDIDTLREMVERSQSNYRAFVTQLALCLTDVEKVGRQFTEGAVTIGELQRYLLNAAMMANEVAVAEHGMYEFEARLREHTTKRVIDIIDTALAIAAMPQSSQS